MTHELLAPHGVRFYARGEAKTAVSDKRTRMSQWQVRRLRSFVETTGYIAATNNEDGQHAAVLAITSAGTN